MMPAAAYRSLDYNNPAVWDIRQAFIPKTMVPKAILGDYTVENPLTWYGTGIAGWPKEDQFVQYRYPSEKAGTRIHMIWSDTPCWSTCWNGGYTLAKAVQSPEIEFVLVQHPWIGERLPLCRHSFCPSTPSSKSVTSRWTRPTATRTS